MLGGELRKLLWADQQVLALVKGYCRRSRCRGEKQCPYGIAGIWEAHRLEM